MYDLHADMVYLAEHDGKCTKDIGKAHHAADPVKKERFIPLEKIHQLVANNVI